jgi:hypothetical protein
MFLSEEIMGVLAGPWEHEALRYRGGRLRGDLEEFVKGEELAVCLEPFVAKAAYMGRLAPVEDGVWDIRSRDPKPALRVIGFFAELDVFIALRWAPRSKLIKGASRPPLGARDSREWRDVVVQCKTDWTNLFHAYRPVTGECINDYISEHVHAV